MLAVDPLGNRAVAPIVCGMNEPLCGGGGREGEQKEMSAWTDRCCDLSVSPQVPVLGTSSPMQQCWEMRPNKR